MERIKVVHCADVHIGTGIKSLGRKGSARQAELKNTFLGILAAAKAEQADIVLIAGDLFDGLTIPEPVLAEIRDGFAELAPAYVAVAPGNHDPYTRQSPYAREGFWPENVIIFSGQAEYKVLEPLGVGILGAAFTGSYAKDSLLGGISCPDDGRIHLGVLHGTLVTEGQSCDYNPVSEAQIAASRLDYLALGHIHERSPTKQAGQTIYSYSGCPEGRGFDEVGTKGYYTGTVGSGFVSMEFHPACRREYVRLQVDLSGVLNSRDGAKRIRKRMQEVLGSTYGEHLYKILLKGVITDTAAYSIEEIQTDLSEVYYCRIQDDMELDIDFTEASEQTTLKGIFIRQMKALLEEEADPQELQRIQLALKLGIKSFSKEVAYHED